MHISEKVTKSCSSWSVNSIFSNLISYKTFLISWVWDGGVAPLTRTCHLKSIHRKDYLTYIPTNCVLTVLHLNLNVCTDRNLWASVIKRRDVSVSSGRYCPLLTVPENLFLTWEVNQLHINVLFWPTSWSFQIEILCKTHKHIFWATWNTFYK